MAKFIDLTGQKFGRLTVLERDSKDKAGHIKWKCRCDCGNEIITSGCHLKSGHTTSCGCYRDELIENLNKGKSLMQDLTGNKYNRLTVLEFSHFSNDKKRTYWECICDCGNKTIVRADQLKSGSTKSCGCIMADIYKSRIGKSTARRHRGFAYSKTRIYGIYQGMIVRCYKENTKNYKNYGGRGIKICDEWLDSFITFYDWAMENGYDDTLTIDRKDVNGNYEPSNCRWATYKEQANNKRTNVFLEYNGDVKTVKEWSEFTGLAYSCLTYRLQSGWSVEKALTTPSRKTFVEYNGITDTLKGWAKRLGVKYKTLEYRLYHGWSLEKTLSTPVRKHKITQKAV